MKFDDLSMELVDIALDHIEPKTYDLGNMTQPAETYVGKLVTLQSQGWVSFTDDFSLDNLHVQTTRVFMKEFEARGMHDWYLPEPGRLVDHYAADAMYGAF